jgi:hypothetical protein
MSTDPKSTVRPACPACGFSIRGISVHRIVLWLIAIAIVSFAAGFTIQALSGGFPPAPGQPLSPFSSAAIAGPNTTTVSLDGATAGDVQLTLGAGELSVTGGAPADALMEATVFSAAGIWQPALVQGINGSVKSVAVSDKGHKGKEWFAVDSPNSWTIALQEDVPLRLDVSVGGGDTRLHLGSLSIETLAVRTGAGDTEIDLAGYHGGQVNATVKNGVGDLTLRVPRAGNTRVRVHNGIGDVDSNGFIREGDTYLTPGFNASLAVSEISLDQGVGSIILETV